MYEQRDSEIDVGRCIANYLIVLLHAGGAAVQYARSGTIETIVCDFITQRCCNVALAALFFISGYLLFRSYRLSDWPQKIARRLRRLMVPYVVWNLIFVGFYLSVASFFPRIAARVSQFGINTFAGAVDKIIGPFTAPIDVPLWYVRFIFVFALLSPILWLLLRHRGGRIIALVVAASHFIAVEWWGCGGGVEGYPPIAILPMVFGAVIATGGVAAVAGRHTLPGGGLVGIFACNWWAFLGVGCLVLDFVDIAGGRQVGNLNLQGVLKVPLYFWLVGKLDAKRLLATPWFRMAKDASFFVFVGHFFFCSLWVHTSGGFFPAWPIGGYVMPMLMFMGPGLATTLLTWRLWRVVWRKIV